MRPKIFLICVCAILFASACGSQPVPEDVTAQVEEAGGLPPMALPLANYPPGVTPTYVENGDFWLVHTADDQFFAFAPVSPDYDRTITVAECRYAWSEPVGRFVDPCSGDEWDVDGRLNLEHSAERWSNRGLDRYAVSIENDTIFVYVDRLLRGLPIGQAPTATAVPPATPAASATPTATPTAVAVAAATAELPPTAALEAAPATISAPASATAPAPPGTVSGIREPLLIDGERGRIYASALLNGQPRTVVLDTREGGLLAAFDVAGSLALDRINQRLIVDQAQTGLVIIDTESGETLAEIPLPPAEETVVPQVEPATGLLYAFRDQSVYVVDPSTGDITDTNTLHIERTSCDIYSGEAPIWRSEYDLIAQVLYLTFITRTCTPHVSATIIAYDPQTMAELGRYGVDGSYQAVPFQGSLYGTSTASSLVGRSLFWAWNPQGAWYESGSSAVAHDGIVADWGRQLIYEAVNGQIRVVDPATREVLGEKAVDLLAGNGRLAGHDPHSDNLYFLTEDGRLQLLPAAVIQ